VSESSAEGVRRLQESLGARVCLPGSAAYSAALSRVFFPDAARRTPACVVEPASAAEAATVMKIASAAGSAVTVRGGGLSSSCVSDGAVMLDLSTHLNYARAEPGPGGEPDRVTVGGGATMGTLLDAAAGAGRMVPAGIVRLAGLGLATRGGVGYLTRSLGLTLDHLAAVQLVLPGGEITELSDDSTGTDAELWWAVRGCAPSFGVVTRATFRTHPARPVFVDRLVTGPDALPAYFQIAPGLPRHTSMSAVAGTVPGEPGTPGLLVYTVCASGAPADVAAARQAASAVAGSSATGLIARKEETGLFNRGFPEMALLHRDGREPEPVRPPAAGRRTDFFFGKSVFLDATPGADVAAALAEQLRQAPTPACRIDLQHTGGALADVPDTGTAFWGRAAEWNAPVNAITGDLGQRAECVEWARQAIGAYAAHTAGVYSVELRPGLPETGAEVQAAFGGNLARLQRLARDCDPAGVLSRYAPLSPS
jgi:FAD/FMN-containing dehydrogenase